MEEYTNNMSKRQIRHTLDSLLEGIQVIDFNWRYLYVNTVITAQYESTEKEFHSQTMMDKYPDIETTEIFSVLQDCMINRKPERIEIELVCSDSIRWFDLSVIAVEEGICIMSLDITAHKMAKEKISKANRLYAFISQVNQNIVRVTDEETLFRNSCSIAVEFGKFEVAWIGLFDFERKTITVADQSGILDEDLPQFVNSSYEIDGPQDYVLQNNTHYICNDVANEGMLKKLRPFAEKHGIQSCIILPIRKAGKIIGTLNLYSTKINFSDKEETKLLLEVTGDISYALDMFEKNKRHVIAEELIVKNEKRFRVLIEKSADIKTLTAINGKVVYASPSIKKVLGYSPKEFTMLPFFAIFHPDDIPSIIKMRQKLVLTPGRSMKRQLRLLHKNGNWIWCEGSITNLLHEEGIEALVSNFSDISEKRSTAQQREFDRNNLYALINNTNDLMWSVDTDFKLITSNQLFDKVANLASGKMIEKGVSNLVLEGFSGNQLQRYKKFYERALAGETFTEIEYTTSPDESWSEISFFPIKKKKEIIGTACYSRDITKRKKSELELEKQNKELIKANFELDRFVYSVSHDLRSPLTSMLGLISFIEEDSKEEDTLEHLKLIKSSINRLDSSIKNILSYSHNNRAALEITHIPLSKTVTEIINSLSSMNNAEGIHFEVVVEEEYPFYSDKQRFSTVIENLISNAIKYHRSTERGRFIKVSGKATKEELRLIVQDNGIGIASENHEKIFDMFYRLPSEIPGSGIGLYIVKETIETMLGTLLIDSEQGAGTTFNITLKNL